MSLTVKRSMIDDGSVGWHVIVEKSGAALPWTFLRQKDAESAMRAIENELRWDLGWEEQVEECLRYGIKNIRKKMMEALAW